MRRSTLLLVLVACGCVDPTSANVTDAGTSDADTDADTDTDSGSDTQVDTETDTGPTAACDGVPALCDEIGDDPATQYSGCCHDNTVYWCQYDSTGNWILYEHPCDEAEVCSFNGQYMWCLDPEDPTTVEEICADPTPSLVVGENLGTTGGAYNIFGAGCPDFTPFSAGPEDIWTLSLAAPENLLLTLDSQAGNFDGVLRVLSECSAAEDALLACADAVNESSTEQLSLDLPTGTYFVMVDGYHTEDQGAYTLTYVQPDPGATCADLRVAEGGVVYSGNTAAATANYQASCDGYTSGPDQVWAYTATGNTPVNAQMIFEDPGHYCALSARTICQDGNSELACNDDWEDATTDGVCTITFQGITGTTYYLIADRNAVSDTGGAYEFSVWQL